METLLAHSIGCAPTNRDTTQTEEYREKRWRNSRREGSETFQETPPHLLALPNGDHNHFCHPHHHEEGQEEDASPHYRRERSMSEVLADVIQEGIHEVKDEFLQVKEVLTEVIQEPVLPVKPREEGDHDKKLSALALSILVFYKVSGDTVRSY